MSKKQISWWGGAALVVLFFAYPAKITVAPPYDVTLLNQFNKPMATAPVSEVWWQTSVERKEHTEQRTTDADGRVSFPERTMRAPLFQRMVGCLAYLGREGLAASCGSQSSVSATGDVKELMRADVTLGSFSNLHQLKLIVEPCDPGQPAIC